MGGLDIVKFTVREANQVAFLRSVNLKLSLFVNAQNGRESKLMI